MGSGSNGPFGYRESREADGHYNLLVILPAASAPGLAQQFWDRRAAELCGRADFSKTIFRADRLTQHYDHYGGRPGDFILQGLVDCAAHP